VPEFTVLRTLSVCVYILLIIGFANRGRRRVHIPLMTTAFAIDMAMLLYIELSRDAIATARTTHSGLLQFHIGLSVVVIVLYLGQVYTGIRKARGRSSRWHGKAGVVLLVARLGNLITSFMIG